MRVVSQPPRDHSVDDLDEEDVDPTLATSAEDEDDEPGTLVAGPAARRKSGTIGAAEVVRAFHTASTQQLPASKVLGATTDDTSIRHTTSTASTPFEALRLEEVSRTRIFLKTCALIVVAVAAALPFIGGHPDAKRLVYIGCVLAAATMGWLYWEIRDSSRYDVRKVTVVGFSLIVTAYLGVYYWGIYSPAPAIILMGIYFFSLGGSRSATLAIYATCALVQAGLALLIVVELVPDHGLIRASHLDTRDQIVTQMVVQVLFACAYLIARASRQATIDAIEELEVAARAVAAREALLLEARQDLDRALQVGGAGRFSEQRLGSFVLGNVLGRGGMGEVYEAVHAHTNEPAAVKLLHAHALANPDHVTRFLRESEAASSLRSEHVVTVLEVGRTEGALPFLAMERLRGNDLAYHLRRKRRLSPARVVALVRQVGSGLEAARAAGIVHRDIKPQNLFLAEVGSVAVWKILDFGVSKLAGSGGTLTRGHVVGTPGYMAPEQARGLEVDHRTDLYALASIAYRALTGSPPFSGKDVPTTLYDVVYKMPKRPAELIEVHEDVEFVLAIGLAKDPEHRWDSGAELADALAESIKGRLRDDWRARGRALVTAHPWGTVL
jgi:serine/threonine-protein kinase